jgi:hypothetical protein
MPFNDQGIDGRQYTLSVLVVLENPYQLEKDISLGIKLKHTSKDYFHYSQQLIKSKAFQNGDIWEGPKEPVGLYSNVSNGLGILAAYSQVIDSLSVVKQ